MMDHVVVVVRRENMQTNDEKVERWVRQQSTYSIPGLLREYLGKLDHIGIVIEGLRERDHGISTILLVAVACGSEKGAECIHGDGVALIAATGSILMIGQAVNHTIIVNMNRK